MDKSNEHHHEEEEEDTRFRHSEDKHCTTRHQKKPSSSWKITIQNLLFSTANHRLKRSKEANNPIAERQLEGGHETGVPRNGGKRSTHLPTAARPRKRGAEPQEPHPFLPDQATTVRASLWRHVACSFARKDSLLILPGPNLFNTASSERTYKQGIAQARKIKMRIRCGHSGGKKWSLRLPGMFTLAIMAMWLIVLAVVRTSSTP
jgi:hypothetical protein